MEPRRSRSPLHTPNRGCGSRQADRQLYLFIKPLFRPPSTPPWSETLVYAILWVITFSNVVLALFLYSSNSHWPVWASPTWLAFESVNFGITSLLIYVVGGLPLASPEALVSYVPLPFIPWPFAGEVQAEKS